MINVYFSVCVQVLEPVLLPHAPHPPLPCPPQVWLSVCLSVCPLISLSISQCGTVLDRLFSSPLCGEVCLGTLPGSITASLSLTLNFCPQLSCEICVIMKTNYLIWAVCLCLCLCLCLFTSSLVTLFYLVFRQVSVSVTAACLIHIVVSLAGWTQDGKRWCLVSYFKVYVWWDSRNTEYHQTEVLTTRWQECSISFPPWY